MPKGVREKPNEEKDLVKASRWASTLIALCETRPEVAEELGITPADVDLARRELDMNQRIIGSVPTAKSMYLVGLSGGCSREEILTRHHNTILAIHNLAPMAGYVLAAKLDDHQAPGSTRVALEIAKGTGILIPADPISTRKRKELLDEDVLEHKSTETLKAEVLDFS